MLEDEEFPDLFNRQEGKSKN